MKPIRLWISILLCSVALACAAPAAHAADHGEAHVGEPAGGASPAELPKIDLAIVTLVVFLLLLAILGKAAWPKITTLLEQREQRIADEIAAAKEQNERAKELLAAYEVKLNAAQSQVKEIIAEARRDAQHTKDEIVAAAREEAQAEKNRALSEIGVATEGALKELAEKSASMAVQLAGKIVGERLRPEDHNKLIQESVGRFKQSQPSRN